MATTKKRLGRGLGNLIAGGRQAAPQKAAVTSPPPVRKTATKPAAKKGLAQRRTVKARASAVKKKVEAMPDPNPMPQAEPVPGVLPFQEIPVQSIEANPYQPRREIAQDKVKELADSIRSEGLLQPIVVRKVGERFQLIAGERRWRAHQSLGLKSIAARILDASDTSSAVISLIENLQREGLNPIEEALGYASLMGDFDLTQEGVSERLGKARASIANALRLLQLDREIQGYIAKGMLSVGHAKVILGLEDPSQRLLLARRILESGMSVREAERQVKRFKSDSPGKTGQSRNIPEMESTIIRDLEKQLSSRLNTKVLLKHTPKKGKIVIEYHGNEDLQRILEKTGLDT